MQICVICRGDFQKKHNFEICLHSSFRGAVIYKARICSKASRRTLRRCAKKLSALDICFVAIEDDPLFAEVLRSFGLSPVTGRDFLARMAAEMALLFAEGHGFDKSFFIRGGSFFSATRTALRLFEETDEVFLTSADFEAVAEAVTDACGAVVRTTPPEDIITLDLCDSAFSVCRKGLRATFSDFSFLLPGFDSSDISSECIPALAEALEICGFLGNNEIKIELLSK